MSICSGSSSIKSWSRSRTSISSTGESRLMVLSAFWTIMDSFMLPLLFQGLTSPELMPLAHPECTQAVVELL